jgi:hypothetical protein
VDELVDNRITDVSTIIEDLGIPFDKPGYARNVWDMQLYNNRIYLGHGNCVNFGPNPNAGPISIFYYDLVQMKFVKQYTTSEEQLENYKILDGQLYLLGRDPKEDWTLGNFYKLVEDKWQKIRNIPNAIHTFDMVSVNGKLYVSTGSTDNNTIYRSENYGNTWSVVPCSTNPPYFPISSRMYTLFYLNNKIYATSVIFQASLDATRNRAIVIDGASISTVNINRNKMLPGSPNDSTYYRLLRGTVALGNMIYIAEKYDYYKDWLPEGLYYAPEINQAKRAIFPEVSVIPMDINVRGNIVYAIAYKKVSDNQYTNIVYKTENLSNWSEVLRFNYETFARSFEEINGDYYFGMGCYNDIVPGSVGKILRVKAISGL